MKKNLLIKNRKSPNFVIKECFFSVKKSVIALNYRQLSADIKMKLILLVNCKK